MPDMAKRHFAGHLASGHQDGRGVGVDAVGVLFSAPVHLQQFIGYWLDLEPDDRWQLGKPRALGRSTSIGTRVWSRASKFRILVGPLSLADYKRLLPGQGSLERLEAIVRNHVGDALDWDVNLILRAADVPRVGLGRRQCCTGPYHLGRYAPRQRAMTPTIFTFHRRMFWRVSAPWPTPILRGRKA